MKFYEDVVPGCSYVFIFYCFECFGDCTATVNDIGLCNLNGSTKYKNIREYIYVAKIDKDVTTIYKNKTFFINIYL